MEKFSSFWSTSPASQRPKIGFADLDDARVEAALLQIKQENWAEPLLIPGDKGDTLETGAFMLKSGDIDGLVAGATRSTADVVKAALHIIGARDRHTMVSGLFFVESEFLSACGVTPEDKAPFLFADCAVVPDPSPRVLALIGVQAARAYRFFTGLKPKVAFLSFSTRGSARHALVDRLVSAVELARQLAPEEDFDGELQADAAINPDVARIKNATDSSVAGRANVFIFPTLEAGNISYKLVQRFSKARVAGPVLWGLKKPMSDLSRGCSTEEIIDTARVLCRLIGGQ